MAVLLYRDTTGWKYVGVPPHEHDNPKRVVGEIMAFAGDSAPGGWLRCDGAVYPTTTYPDLFAAIGHKWGGIDAQFAVPNLNSRSLVGFGGVIGTAVGAYGGSEQHTHLGNPMGAHDHVAPAVNTSSVGHAHTVDPAAVTSSSAGSHGHTAVSAGAHTHSTGGPSQLVSTYDGGLAGPSPAGPAHTHTANSSGSHGHTINSGGAHTHSINIPSVATTNVAHAHTVTPNIDTASAGTPTIQSASSHDPYAVVNYVIYAGA